MVDLLTAFIGVAMVVFGAMGIVLGVILIGTDLFGGDDDD
jgi:hypothetical protein